MILPRLWPVALVLMATLASPSRADDQPPPDAAKAAAPKTEAPKTEAPKADAPPTSSPTTNDQALPPAPVRTVNGDDRARAATASGVSAFVGVVLGGLGIPLASGLALANVGVGQDVLLYAGVGGGALGAFIGGAVGAAPTTTPWLGPLAVGSAAAAASLIGLVPAALLGGSVFAGSTGDAWADAANSGLLVVTMVAATAAAAGTGAWLAAPTEVQSQ